MTPRQQCISAKFKVHTWAGSAFFTYTLWGTEITYKPLLYFLVIWCGAIVMIPNFITLFKYETGSLLTESIFHSLQIYFIYLNM